MSWKLKKKALALLAAEQGTVYRDWGGRVSIALVYPNTYAVGMSNLGFQTIYRHLNALPDVVCERVFLPEPADLEEMRRTSTPPQSLESQRPLTDFQLIGFSVTYEGDYVNVLRLLELAGIPLRAVERRAHDPLILMGGVCAFSNPEPIAPFMDFVVVGEGEELVGELMQAYREGYRERETFLDGLVGLEGIYIPERHDVSYAGDGIVADVKPRQGAPAVVSKRRLKQVDAFRTIAAVKTPNAEYGHMALLEVGKGCGRGCRFCLEGQVYRPVRHRSVAALSATIAELAAQGEKRIGLVGACVSDYPWLGELLKVVEDNGMELSISSLRADSLTDDLVASLARGGHRTLTMAPEAGTERLRRVIRKAITDEQLMAACDLVRARGIPNLKCYFMIGQPTETPEDVAAIPDLAGRMLERLRVLHENPREAALQALLARGDRRVGDFLELAARLEGDWRRALREWDGDPAFYTTRERPVAERLPWDHFDVGVKKAGLVREWERALAGEPALAGTA